jgi:O-antigen ligase
LRIQPLNIFLGAALGFFIAYFFGIGWYLSLIPTVGIVACYFLLYYPKHVFISLAFFTPLSVNIEEYSDQLGLFLPTEPLLIGLTLLGLATFIFKHELTLNFLKEPITIILLLYLSWLGVTCITSTHPIISIKSLLARIWFIIPCFFLSVVFFNSWKSIRQFFWWFTLGMVLVIIYTIFNHAGYNFGEKESHWVMSPFFKDHTIYGAVVALALPFPLVLFFSSKQTALNTAVLVLFFIVLFLGLYFSYTRAAWLSVFGAFAILSLVFFQIKLRWVVLCVSGLILFLLSYKETIQLEMARNKVEHTTESFDDRLKSATNVSTDASNLERINRWACAIEMFKEKPIYGFGPGTFAFEYARFQEPENLTIISTNFGDLGNAHSEYLSALSETGIIGLVLFVGFVGMSFYMVIKLIQKAKTQNRKVYVMANGILFSLSTYFIHGLLNNFLDTDKAAYPVLTMIALCYVLQNKLVTQPNGRV